MKIGSRLPIELVAVTISACVTATPPPAPRYVQSGGLPSGAYGMLSGVIVDSDSDAPIANVVVAVEDRSVPTAADGTFELKLDHGGAYRAVFWKQGFETVAASNVRVDVGTNTRIRVVLHPGEDDVEMLGEAIVPPVLVSGPPAPALAAAYGDVIIRCVITVEGSVRGCFVKQGSMLGGAKWIHALEARKYRPALREDKPLEVWYTFRIHVH